MITIKQAAVIFGVSPRRISQMIEEGTLERPKAGHVSCESLARVLVKEREAMTEDEADFEKDKARKMRADAEMAELLTAKEGGKLVELKKIERRWTGALVGLRARCMAMPARIGPMVVVAADAAAASKLIETEMRIAFDSIADDGPEDEVEEVTELEKTGEAECEEE